MVKNIQAGCDLYKQAKESFVEIRRTGEEVVAIGKELHGFWNQLLAFFGSKPKPKAAKSVGNSKKSDYVAVDETQVKADIVKNLSEFFKLQEQLETHIRESEEKARTVVFADDVNLMEEALNRVLAQQEMDIAEICKEISQWSVDKKKEFFYASREIVEFNHNLLMTKYPKNMSIKFWHDLRDNS